MMNLFLKIFFPILWPPNSLILIYQESDSSYSKIWWKTTCILNIFSLTAILHHLIFYPQTCMLNPFGKDYTYIHTLHSWLSRDPSFPWSLIIMSMCMRMGRRSKWLQILIAPFFISFIPLTIWIWDIPFTNRLICRYFHDGKFILYDNVPLRTLHFYLLGIIIYSIFIIYFLVKSPKLKQSNVQ